jgi:hypothetical protein
VLRLGDDAFTDVLSTLYTSTGVAFPTYWDEYGAPVGAGPSSTAFWNRIRSVGNPKDFDPVTGQQPCTLSIGNGVWSVEGSGHSDDRDEGIAMMIYHDVQVEHRAFPIERTPSSTQAV